ncbi:hypothetical protein, partial [Streptomyces mirabilis]|uniref:hypothetical protein n=1 Tax=Streptomyces mirabilis TaxID=68239 RepID=UPI002E207218
LWEFLAEFRPGTRLAANSLRVYAGRWRGPGFAREFAWRQILGLWVEFWFMYFAWRQNSCLVFIGPLARPFIGFLSWCEFSERWRA